MASGINIYSELLISAIRIADIISVSLILNKKMLMPLAIDVTWSRGLSSIISRSAEFCTRCNGAIVDRGKL